MDASLFRLSWRWFLIVENQIRQQFRPYRQFPVVVNQSHRPEFIHEVGNPGSRGSHHFGERLVTQHRQAAFPRAAMLGHPGKFQ